MQLKYLFVKYQKVIAIENIKNLGRIYIDSKTKNK